MTGIHHACLQSAQCDQPDSRTTARRDFADAIVVWIGNKHVAARIDGNSNRKAEGSVGTGAVG